MRILTIMVRYGTGSYPNAEAEIDGIFGRQMRAAERAVVIVDNALPSGFVERSGPRTLIGGDNTCREFSAFDRGVQFVGHDIWGFDLVHLATEAFNTLYVDYLMRFDQGLLEAIVKRPVCVGHIDCYNEAIEALGYTSQHWLRSCFIFMPPTEIKALGSLVSVRDGARFFSGKPDEPFLTSAPLSPRFRQYIIEWLTGQDIGQGVVWHSGFTLTAEKMAVFEAKALAILNEHLLRVRLSAMGCRVIDVTWLASALARGPATSVPWNASWREQLAGRGIAALELPARQ